MGICFNCQDRHYKCHSTCQKYKAERKTLDEYKRSRRNEMIAADVSGETWNYDKRGIKR